MSEDRLVRIEGTLQVLAAGQQELRTGLANVEETVATLVVGQQELRTGLAELGARVDDTRVDVGRLRDETGAGFEELRRHMHVLYENTLDRISALAYDPAPIRREFQAADDTIRETFNQRLDPIEAFVRSETRRSHRKTRR